MLDVVETPETRGWWEGGGIRKNLTHSGEEMGNAATQKAEKKGRKVREKQDTMTLYILGFPSRRRVWVGGKETHL